MKTKLMLPVITGLVCCCFYSLALTTKETTEDKKDRPKMAIEYFAEFDLSDTKVFGASHANDEGKFFGQFEAKRACPDGWHLPTERELEGLAPKEGRNEKEYKLVTPVKFFKGGPNVMNWPEKIQIGKEDTAKVYFGDFAYPGNNICYAIRFKKDNVQTMDNKLMAAYKYELLGVKSLSNDGGNLRPGPTFRLKITVRYLGEDFSGTIVDVANEEFWQSNNGDDVVRVFSAGGAAVFNGNNATFIPGAGGFYMSSSTYIAKDEFPDLNIYKRPSDGMAFFDFGMGGAGISGRSPSNLKSFVRCVSDK